MVSFSIQNNEEMGWCVGVGVESKSVCIYPTLHHLTTHMHTKVRNSSLALITPNEGHNEPHLLRLLSVMSSSIAWRSVCQFVRLPRFSSRDKVGHYQFAWP
jgi:hypothetical protein